MPRTARAANRAKPRMVYTYDSRVHTYMSVPWCHQHQVGANLCLCVCVHVLCALPRLTRMAYIADGERKGRRGRRRRTGDSWRTDAIALFIRISSEILREPALLTLSGKQVECNRFSRIFDLHIRHASNRESPRFASRIRVLDPR